jgi:hypothetical protein
MCKDSNEKKSNVRECVYVRERMSGYENERTEEERKKMVYQGVAVDCSYMLTIWRETSKEFVRNVKK